MGRILSWVLPIAAIAAVSFGGIRESAAFCGFYVAGADAKLFNNATLVVMMREGNRTVLSMQNNYQGPPENFAMVVPVPVVLQKENVKTLPREVFDRIDRLAAPRLVEYWERDPCEPLAFATASGLAPIGGPTSVEEKGGVKIEAQFKVAEYDIVVLSATDSAGLETWLKEQKYSIPEGAEPFLRPYVQQGSKFFVAKVDVTKVKMDGGQAMLSPLRFHYDDEKFRLPVRLGLINAKGSQDLIVHILAHNQRYEAANYKNVTIPTNLDLAEGVKPRFGEFYAKLFDETLAKHKGAVVTEYAWDSSTCDPCPVPALRPDELALFGSDVLSTTEAEPRGGRWGRGFVLTRLHARYDSKFLGEDLVFKKAEPIAGGREFPKRDKKPIYGMESSSRNQFQGRYAIRHAWKGKVNCEKPQYGIWEGPPGGRKGVEAATGLAFAPRGAITLAKFTSQDIPEIGVKAAAAKPAPTASGSAAAAPSVAASGAPPPAVAPTSGGCGCRLSATAPPETPWLPLVALLGSGVGLGVLRRRRRPRA